MPPMPSRDAGPGRARVERAAAPSTPSGPDRTPRAGQGRLTMAEFDLIDRIRRRALARHDVVLGIGDDAALLDVPAGRRLVVAMDTLNAGVHFPVDTAPRDVGWKAVAVPPDAPPDPADPRRLFDASRHGLSNRGHTFGDKLDEAERSDLIEYLKTL